MGRGMGGSLARPAAPPGAPAALGEDRLARGGAAAGGTPRGAKTRDTGRDAPTSRPPVARSGVRLSLVAARARHTSAALDVANPAAAPPGAASHRVGLC